MVSAAISAPPIFCSGPKTFEKWNKTRGILGRILQENIAETAN